MNPRIGLTGGIGSGKSTAARWLAARGARVVDTDAIARALTAPGGAALPAIAAAFGPEALDAQGALDRDRMRQIVFADPQARVRLEGILHPLIGEETDRQASDAAAGQPIVFDVPLLVEALPRWRSRVDRILVIDCPEERQVARVMQRSGWAADEVRRVIAQQASRDARRAVADAVILNDGPDPARLEAELEALWRRGFFGLPGTPAL